MLNGPFPFAFFGPLQIALFLAAHVAVLGWLYHHCQRPAVLAQLAWTIYVRLLAPGVAQWMIENFGRQDPAAFRTTLLALNTVTDVVGTAIFVWLIVSLVGWARPELLRRRARDAPDTPENLAARFGPPPPPPA